MTAELHRASERKNNLSAVSPFTIKSHLRCHPAYFALSAQSEHRPVDLRAAMTPDEAAFSPEIRDESKKNAEVVGLDEGKSGNRGCQRTTTIPTSPLNPSFRAGIPGGAIQSPRSMRMLIW